MLDLKVDTICIFGALGQGFDKIVALIIRVGFWRLLYYNYNEEPQNSIGNYLGPCFRVSGFRF